MSSSATRSAAVVRACVVHAVKDGEVLMEQMIRRARAELTEAQEQSGDVLQRTDIADAIRALDTHEAALLKNYPLALLETFSDGGGPANKARASLDKGLELGELTLLDESEVLAQVELARAQQIASHASDVALAELNRYMSSAQGLSRVQPESNPLRPENYIRALQSAVEQCALPALTRKLWMERMREVLGTELTACYQRATQSLREHGVAPVGYSLATPAGGQRSRAGAQAQQQRSLQDGVQAERRDNAHPAANGFTADTATDPQEAMLAAGILRQMLASGGDPFAFNAVPSMPTMPRLVPVSQSAKSPRQVMMTPVQAVPVMAYSSSQAAEALEDIAQLERLVGRLSGSLGGTPRAPGVPSQQAGAAGSLHAWPGASMPGQLSPSGHLTSRSATEVLSRMMDHIAQDSRLLAPVQRAVQNLEPALKQLVRQDPSFFSNEHHPARRLLDALTQRSLVFKDADSKGFRKYIQVVNAAVQHLSTVPVHDANAFEHVSDALESAWNTQVQQLRRRQEDEQKALAESEQRDLLMARLVSDFRQLPEARLASADMLDFVTGVWAAVVVHAQTAAMRDGVEPDEDAQDYLAVVPHLLWCAQPDPEPEHAQNMLPALAPMLSTVRKGLLSIGESDQHIADALQRLAELQHRVTQSAEHLRITQEVDLELEPAARSDGVVDARKVPNDAAEVLPRNLPVSDALPSESGAQAADVPAGDPIDGELELGQWVELTTNLRTVRTQLTWVSPHNTLFLFTALDASTQSMTRRMLDKLRVEGMIRKVGDQRVVARALGAVVADASARGRNKAA